MKIELTARERDRLIEAVTIWAEQDQIIRRETKSFRALIVTCEGFERPNPENGSPGRETCWRVPEEMRDLCPACEAHGDRRKVRWAAMAKRQGAIRRIRNLFTEQPKRAVKP